MHKYKLNIKKTFKIIGYILVIISFAFIIYNFKKVDFKLISQNINIYLIFFLVIASFICAFIVFLYSLSWKIILEFFCKKKLNLTNISSIYLKSNIAKYVPGNVFHFAGRYYLLRETGLSSKIILYSTASEIFFLIFTSIIIVLIGLITKIIHVPTILFEKMWGYLFYFGVTIFIITCAVLFIYVIIKKKNIGILIYLKYFFKRKYIYICLLVSLIYFFIFIIISVLLYAIIIELLKINININDFLFIFFSFSLAWVIGYLVPGAPGGLGIRESLLLIMLGSMFETGIVVIAVLILRVITIIGDVLAFIFGNILCRKNHYQ